ncbi:aminoacyl tRNA synthase complex-interacting multifunctional protein 1 [Abrus precatorius]|uniref:Aminoacyl tRNA synthase complex-interacting multifunctional protein 1 n=1 Tax=Abrus precatorius TaxID=3816 RepID=A0A8B8LJ59_ABRPR|nr:aminoacyl tRNA synthase complex-interacting multifunctional protein 1 [Abrus precatorius]
MANALKVGSVISLCSLRRRSTSPHHSLLPNSTRFRSQFPFFSLSSSPKPYGFPSFCTLSSPSSSAEEAVREAIVNDGEAENSIKDAAGLLDIRVGRILRAWKHDEADSLYVEEVDIGEAEPRIICSGLVNYIPLQHLQGKKVIVLSNLKPRNMRGVKSCGMLMAASDAKHENVELLFPPEEATPGERIWFGTEDEKDNQPAAATPNQIQKKKIWELVQPHLKTDASCIAMLGMHVMRTSVGSVACQSLQNANIS